MRTMSEPEWAAKAFADIEVAERIYRKWGVLDDALQAKLTSEKDILWMRMSPAQRAQFKPLLAAERTSILRALWRIDAALRVRQGMVDRNAAAFERAEMWFEALVSSARSRIYDQKRHEIVAMSRQVAVASAGTWRGDRISVMFKELAIPPTFHPTAAAMPPKVYARAASTHGVIEQIIRDVMADPTGGDDEHSLRRVEFRSDTDDPLTVAEALQTMREYVATTAPQRLLTAEVQQALDVAAWLEPESRTSDFEELMPGTFAMRVLAEFLRTAPNPGAWPQRVELALGLARLHEEEVSR